MGTTTEIYDYLRILMARGGTPHCPDCDKPIGTQSSSEVIEKIMSMPEGTRVYLLAPVNIQVGEKYDTLWDDLRSRGLREFEWMAKPTRWKSRQQSTGDENIAWKRSWIERSSRLLHEGELQKAAKPPCRSVWV